MQTEFQAKVALLGSLTIVCAVAAAARVAAAGRGLAGRPLAAWMSRAASRGRRGAAKVGGLGLAPPRCSRASSSWPASRRGPSTAVAAPLVDTGQLPQITILHSSGVSSQLDRRTAREIAAEPGARPAGAGPRRSRRVTTSCASPRSCCQALTEITGHDQAGHEMEITVPTYRLERLRMKLRPAEGQGEPIVVVDATGEIQESVYGGTPQRLVLRSKPREFTGTFQMDRGRVGLRGDLVLGREGARPEGGRSAGSLLVAKSFDGVRLQDVADKVGLDFRQDDFRFGTTVRRALDDGRRPLLDRLQQRRQARPLRRQLLLGRRRAAMERERRPAAEHAVRERGRQSSWTWARATHADPAVQGNGCVAADLNGDGYTDLFVTTNTYNVLLWNNGDGTFTDGTKAAGIDVVRHLRLAHRAAVADVNGDGRPDIFVSGYANVNGDDVLDGRVPVELPGVPGPALPERGRMRTARVQRRGGEGGHRPAQARTTASAPCSRT